MYNLIMTGEEGAWSGRPYRLELSRFCEHTDKAIADKYKILNERLITELQALPTLFSYEHFKGDAKIGYIKRIINRSGQIQIDYEFYSGFPSITTSQQADLAFELDISKSELWRTHWAIKDVNLTSILIDAGLITTDQLAYIHSIAGTIQFHSCFISYSSKDQEFTERLHADLQVRGVQCWFAPEDLKIGDKVRTRIDESIRTHDKLLLVLSENSIASDWVEKEVEAAFEQERDRKTTVLFPIRLDNAVMESKSGWTADIKRSRHIGDFGNWKDHDAYQEALDRLLRDLKA